MEYTLENELHDKITEEELTDWAIRIRRLSREYIDEIWYNCGFIIQDHAPDLKALRDDDILSIKESLEDAKRVVESLFLESYADDIRKNLELVEKKEKEQEKEQE